MKLRELKWEPFNGDEEQAWESVFTYFAAPNSAEVRAVGHLLWSTDDAVAEGNVDGKAVIEKWRLAHVTEIVDC